MSEEDHSHRPPWRRPLSRRTVLVMSGGALMATVLSSSAGKRPRALVAGSATPTSSLHLVRASDMLVLDFDFYNLAPSFDSDPPRLRRVDTSILAYIVARFEPQHVMEQTFFEDVTNPPAPGAVQSKATGPSRLVFVVPETVKSLPYTEDGLLQWWQWITQAVPGPPNGSSPDALHSDLLVVDWLHLTPEREATWAHATRPVTHGDRTELWHTRLSVRGENGRPQESIGVAESADAVVPTLRAVSYDKPEGLEKTFDALYPPNFVNPPEQIVQLAGNPTLGAYQPVNARLLSLSAVGATLDFDTQWGPTVGFSLKGWEHHSWLGRDNKVVVEEYGFLFPFGHRAVLISETKRQIDETNGVAYLRQYQFIRITERVKSYAAPFQNWGGRAFPFTSITITNTTLPDLPKHPEPLVPGSDPAFWIQDITTPSGDGHADVVFALVATDLAGRRIEFTTSMAFVPSDPATNTGDPLFARIVERFGNYTDITGPPYGPVDTRRVIELRGQEVAYAHEERPGTTSFPTVRWYWGVEGPSGDVKPPLPPGAPPDGQVHAHADSPLFYPRMFAAEAQVPTVDAVIGTGDPVFLVHDRKYLESGFGHDARLVESGNDARIYLRVQTSVYAIYAAIVGGVSTADSPVRRVVENTIKSGGIASPNLAIGALSASLGPISGLQDSIDSVQDSGKIKFNDYFSSLGNTLQQAALFGQIALGALFDDGDISEGAFRLIKLTDYPKDKDGKEDRTAKPIGQTVTGEFQKTLKDSPPPPLVISKDISGNVRTFLSLQISNQINWVTRDEDTLNKAIAKVYGVLTDFSLDLTPIILKFNKFAFTYQLGKGPSCDPDLDSVDFKPPLDFVGALAGLFGGGGSSSAASSRAKRRSKAKSTAVVAAAGKKSGFGFKVLKFDLTHIGVGVTFDIPSLPLGFFALDGLHIEAGVILPFAPLPFAPNSDLPRARFAFGAPDDKFKVSVYGLGGGGHFEIEVSTRRIEKLEASIEVLGNVALDLLVAAGRVLIELGVFFRLEIKNYKDSPDTYTEVHLGGYLRVTGRLSVLGLISITAELYADVEYVNQDGVGSVWFHAHLTVSIDVTFWHVSVGIEFTKTFGGADKATVAAGARTRVLDSTGRPATFGDLVSRDDWKLYCASFAG
jgi:hypothetical protein